MEDGHNIDQDGLMIKKSRMGKYKITHFVIHHGVNISEDVVKSV